MKLMSEELLQKGNVLFVNSDNVPLASIVEKKLTSYNYNILAVSSLSKATTTFDYIFLFNVDIDKKQLDRLKTVGKKILLVFINDRSAFTRSVYLITSSEVKNIKTVYLPEDLSDKETVEKLLWFMMSSSKELSLSIDPLPLKKRLPLQTRKWMQFSSLSRRKLLISFIALFLIVELFFVVPLLTSAYFIKQTFQSIRDNSTKTAISLERARLSFGITEKSYSLSRPILSFFFLAIVPDTIVSVEKSALQTLETSLVLRENSQRVSVLIFKNPKSPPEQHEVMERVIRLKDQSKDLHDAVTTLSQQTAALPSIPFLPIENVRTKLADLEKTTDTVSRLLSHLDSIIGSPTEKTYVVFLYNNMELRPGGGFIGSFAVVKFAKYTLTDLKVYDVYDADGQLKAHIEPPEAIRTYLKQPHWFLRDSNFSADFTQNVKTAEFFMEKEMGISNFDGAVGVTTTGISYLIDAFGSLYLPDFNQTITRQNFYIKTQLSAEKDFFPGSTQKKNVLSSLMRSMILSAEDVSPAAAGASLKQALDEKQMVLYFKDPAIQKDIEYAGWDGNIRLPHCVVTIQHCIVNTLIPIDANLGVNKANFFVSRVMKMRTDMRPDGSSRNVLTTMFINDSPEDVFPGGPYSNYFQVYLPGNITVESVTIDGSVVDWQRRNDGNYTTVAVFLTVPQKQIRRVEITYTLPPIDNGNGAYQLTIQKQIGSENDNISFEFHAPPNISVINKNFSALVKNGGLYYNTHLSTDKIFLIEFIKR